jgi:hypothetical protein
LTVPKYAVIDGRLLTCDGVPVAWLAHLGREGKGSPVKTEAEMEALAQTIVKALNVYGELGGGVCTCDQAGNFCLAHPNCTCGCPRGLHDGDGDLNPHAGACNRGRLACECLMYTPETA